LKILQRIQSFSSQGGKDETVSMSITYPPSYQSNQTDYSLHCDGSDFRADFIPTNPDHDNKNYVTGLPTIILHEWLSKTRAIYHLVPRIYFEVSLIQAYFFIISSIDTRKIIDHAASQHQYLAISIHQLSSMLHGIGDPIAMIYLQCCIIHTLLSSIVHSDQILSIEAGCVTKDDMLMLTLDFLTDFFLQYNRKKKNRRSIERKQVLDTFK
jgi:hypothetical protein